MKNWYINVLITLEVKMGVGEDFKAFCGNLVINNVADISLRYKRITSRLNLDYYNYNSDSLNSLHIGSYGRDTAIKDAHDMDMLFKLPYSVYQNYNAYTHNGQSALLQSVRNSLLKTYPSTSIGGDGQVVVVNFTDQMRFEILPVFINTDKSYTYPDSNNGGSWRSTNPIPEMEAINSRNAATNWNLKQLCRMARSWRRRDQVEISGLQIDTFAYQFIDSWQYKDKSFLYYDYMTRDFFHYLKNINPVQTYWIAPGSGQRVNRKGNFERKAGHAYDRAVEGTRLYHEKKEYTARQAFREIYGGYFPG